MRKKYIRPASDNICLTIADSQLMLSSKDYTGVVRAKQHIVACPESLETNSVDDGQYGFVMEDGRVTFKDLWTENDE